MKDAFRIELLDQGWLNPSEPEYDLCSHGHLRLVVGGVEVVGGGETYGISESALAMLRTLEADHTADAPVADRLIFHGCGNILMMGCPIGPASRFLGGVRPTHGEMRARCRTTLVQPTRSGNASDVCGNMEFTTRG